QPADQPLEIADAVAVRIHVRADEDLVARGAAPPRLAAVSDWRGDRCLGRNDNALKEEDKCEQRDGKTFDHGVSCGKAALGTVAPCGRLGSQGVAHKGRLYR